MELRPLLQLAGPVVIAELGWMTMWLVDMMMVGRVSAEAIGGVSIGGSVFFTAAVFGMGMLLGLDYTVAHAFGSGDFAGAHRSLLHGFCLSVVLALALTAVVYACVPFLYASGIQGAVLEHAIPYLKAVTWSLLPLLLFATLRRYLQGMGIVKPFMFTLISANLVNAAACWILIFGHLGMPAMGAEGAGWATTLSRVYMFLILLVYALLRDRRHQSGLLRTRFRLDSSHIRRLMSLGLPAALQTTLEVGVFAVATGLAGRLDPASLAAHQIALSAASLSFMVPLGVSSAGAVRVGQALGRGDTGAAERAGWTALLVGALFMTAAGLTFIFFPHAIMRSFTTEQAVIDTGAALLFLAALFQLFDGVQVIATGALRGAGDTRTPMIVNLIGHWLLGLPVGYALCFWRGWGVRGLWVGLSVGLIVVAVALLRVWSRRVHDLAEQSAGTRRVA